MFLDLSWSKSLCTPKMLEVHPALYSRSISETCKESPPKRFETFEERERDVRGYLRVVKETRGKLCTQDVGSGLVNPVRGCCRRRGNQPRSRRWEERAKRIGPEVLVHSSRQCLDGCIRVRRKSRVPGGTRRGGGGSGASKIMLRVCVCLTGVREINKKYERNNNCNGRSTDKAKGRKTQQQNGGEPV